MKEDILQSFEIKEINAGTFSGTWSKSDSLFKSTSPIGRQELAGVCETTEEQYEEVIQKSQYIFKSWSQTPAPKRGEVVRKIGNRLRDKKEDLAKLISLEMGKIYTEALGEVQEAIDMADFATGLSRQLYGKTMHSERPEHRMYEQWHPLGPVGVITAFNFPVAVWSWNAFIAAVCGNTIIWKPSEHTPLISIAVMKICEEISREMGVSGLFTMITSKDAQMGKNLAKDTRVPLISATGSCAMGKEVGSVVAQRMGKSILELGGNNSIIVCEDADMELAARAVVFGGVGTAGQRCTSTRRVFAHSDIIDKLKRKLVSSYSSIKIGNPLDEKYLMGPLINEASTEAFKNAIKQAIAEGGEVLVGGNCLEQTLYVEPTIIKMPAQTQIVKEETFAPILYLIEYTLLDDAIELNNEVSQGLSSAIFTNSLKYAEMFLCSAGSDCGIANVNIGTSGAEIGGAFGGEKSTGGGREAGSDSWKAYMRRQTNTINYGSSLPLAQGVEFG